MKKFLALLLSICMLVSMAVIPVTAAEIKDMPEDHWAKKSADRWVANNIMKVDENGNFNPEHKLNRAEFAILLCDLMGYTEKADASTFNDLPADKAAADAILKLKAAGVMNGVGNDMADPNGQLTSEQVFVMVFRALKLKPAANASLTFADSAQVSDWAKAEMATMASLKMVEGVGNNTLAPQQIIANERMAALLDKMVAAYVTEDGTTVDLTKEDVTNPNGVVIIKANNVEVANAADSTAVVVTEDAPKNANVTITGTASDITVAAEGAKVTVGKDAEVASVTVEAPKATVTVNGTVSNTVAVTEKAEGTKTTVAKDATVAEVKVDAPKAETTVAGKVDSVAVGEKANSATTTVAKDAEVGTVAVDAPKANTTVSGKVDTVAVGETATGANVTATSGAKVENVTTAADDVKVNGAKGTISNVTAESGSADIKASGAKVENTGADKVIVDGKKPVEQGKTEVSNQTGTGTTTPSTPSGGGGTPSTPSVTQFTVTFNTSGGSTIASVQVNQGGKVNKPADPTKAGYDFDGWYTTDALSTPFNFAETTITEATTIYAKWTAQPTLKVEASTGNQLNKAVTNIQDGIAFEPVSGTGATTIKVKGVSKYVSTAWDDFSSKADEKTGNYVALKFTLARAGYNEATVTFESSDMNPKTLIATGAGNTTEDLVWQIAKATNKPTTNKPINVTINYTKGEEEKTINYTIDLTGVTLQGENDKIVTFNTDGGSTVPSVTVAAGGTVTKPATDPTKTNAYFVGWYKNAEKTTVWDFATDKVTENTTIYAKFLDVGTATVALRPATGHANIGAGQEDGNFNYGTAYSVAGISIDPANTIKVEQKTTLSLIAKSKGNDSDATTAKQQLYAITRPSASFDGADALVVGVTVEATGGAASATKVKSAATQEGLASATAQAIPAVDGAGNDTYKADGKNFFIWYLPAIKADGSAAAEQTFTKYLMWLNDDGAILKIEKIEVTRAATTPAEYNIVYKDGDTAFEGLTPNKYTYGTGATLATTATKAGQTFAGWYEDKTPGADVQAITSIPATATGDKTFYAKWKEATYTVIFKNGETEVDKQENVAYNTEITAPTTDPTKAGCYFMGWYESTDTENETLVDFTSLKATKDVIYMAKWAKVLTVTPYDYSCQGGTQYITYTLKDGNEDFHTHNRNLAGYKYKATAEGEWLPKDSLYTSLCEETDQSIVDKKLDKDHQYGYTVNRKEANYSFYCLFKAKDRNDYFYAAFEDIPAKIQGEVADFPDTKIQNVSNWKTEVATAPTSATSPAEGGDK